jgi:hypothetical protein
MYKHHVQARTGNTPHPAALGAIIEDLSLVAKMFQAVPVDIADVLAALYEGADPPKGGPAEEFIALHDQSNDASVFPERATARSEALKTLGIDLPVTGGPVQQESHHSDFGTLIPQLAFDTLRRRNR